MNCIWNARAINDYFNTNDNGNNKEIDNINTEKNTTEEIDPVIYRLISDKKYVCIFELLYLNCTQEETGSFKFSFMVKEMYKSCIYMNGDRFIRKEGQDKYRGIRIYYTPTKGFYNHKLLDRPDTGIVIANIDDIVFSITGEKSKYTDKKLYIGR